MKNKIKLKQEKKKMMTMRKTRERDEMKNERTASYDMRRERERKKNPINARNLTVSLK